MSTYTRDRRRASDDYYDDSVYDNTRRNVQSTAVVRRRDSSDYEDDYRREYSPNSGYYKETTIRKSGTRPVGRARSYEHDRSYEDDRSFASSRRDSYYGAAGRRPRYDDRRSSGRSRYDKYSDEYSSRSRSRTPPRRERRKSMPEQALEALGLGGVAAKIMGKSRSRSRSSSRSKRSRSRAGGRGRDSSEHRKEQMQQALKAAIIAGAGAAFSARKEAGGWTGDKGKRVLTAALAAGSVDGFINRDKDPDKHKFRDTVGSVVAGLATDKLVNGRSRSRGPDGRRISPDRAGSRSRSRAGDLLAAGGLAAAAKKFTDNIRARSQSRGRGRAGSADSYGSRSPKRSRSRSVLARGLSKIGLNDQADKVDPAGARARSRSRGGRSRSRSRYVDDDYVDDRHPYDPPNNFNGRGGSVYDNREVGNSHPDSRTRDIDPRSGAMINRPSSTGSVGGVLSPPPPGYHYDTAPHHNGDPETDSDTDLGHSTDDEKVIKKSRKRLAITGGLATVATIHAGHSVYQSVEKRQARKRALRDGTISKEDAEKHKSRDRLQDAASVGLAALGIKGAYSEWKEMKENVDEHKEEAEARKRHQYKREMRRRKSSMVGMSEPSFSNSAPTLGGDSYNYHGNGPYMSGGNAETSHSGLQYQDDNPYGWVNQAQQPPQQYHSPQPTNPQYGYPASPVQGGTGYPPPPGSQPQLPQGV